MQDARCKIQDARSKMQDVFFLLLSSCFLLLFFSADAFAIRKTKAEIDAAKRCVLCHNQVSPGIVNDWERSNHAKALVTCIDCHQADITDADARKHEGEIISAIVSPRDCSRCHPKQVVEFNESLHSKAVSFVQSLEGDRAGDDVLAYKVEGKAAAVMGCEKCHGTIVKVKNGILDKETWPNNGIGRVNPDGSKGSCTACHTRHLFSIAEARTPEACGTCHIGPDHPQYEIYMESKHGVIYSSEKEKWNMDVAASAWDTEHFRAPTCATCHMSGIGELESSHNVSDRLSWELEWPLSEKTKDWKDKRERMQKVCLSCHSKTWVEGYYQQFDNAIILYNDGYYKPIKKEMDELYKLGYLTKDKFDEEIEFKFFEYWHHEGRRARMGAAMMGPDYTQWHGFYELSRNRLELKRMIREIRESREKGK
ncbi:MAG: hydroxylamine oxidoreductase [Nitrospinae bacterium]|nr:hydroxylamine oxidoreductase [Nitrospinota bacterium]